MAWEGTNPVTFNRLGRVDDWNKLWDNADYIHTSVLQIDTSGSGDIIGSTGTPATFKLLRGISASNAVIDVEGSAAELSIAGGAVTATGAGLDSNIVLQSSGSGASYAARLRLADLGGHEFRIQDSTGTELYAFNEDRFVVKTNNIWSEDESDKLQINAGLGSNSSYLNLKAKNQTTGQTGAGVLVLSHFDATIKGFEGRFNQTGGGGTLRSWDFDEDLFSFMNANDNNDSIDFTPSAAKVEGFVDSVSTWSINSTASEGDFRFGNISGLALDYDRSQGALRQYSGGTADADVKWELQATGLQFGDLSAPESEYGDNHFMVRTAAGADMFGVNGATYAHMFWEPMTSTGAANKNMWIDDTTDATYPRLYYKDSSGTTSYVRLNNA